MTEADFLDLMHGRGIDFLALYDGGSMCEVDSLGDFAQQVTGVALNVTRLVNSKVSTTKHYHAFNALS